MPRPTQADSPDASDRRLLERTRRWDQISGLSAVVLSVGGVLYGVRDDPKLMWGCAIWMVLLSAGGWFLGVIIWALRRDPSLDELQENLTVDEELQLLALRRKVSRRFGTVSFPLVICLMALVFLGPPAIYFAPLCLLLGFVVAHRVTRPLRARQIQLLRESPHAKRKSGRR